MNSKSDSQVWELYQKEWRRQEEGLELIPSENYASLEVMAASGGILTNKYSEGYPHKRYYGGNEFVDEIENLAIERAKKLFGYAHANVQAHSGSSANMAAYYALLERGDKLMGLKLSEGGHITHGLPINFSGKYYEIVEYGVDPDTHLLNYDEIARIADLHKPKLIVCGFTAYPRIVDFEKFGKIAKESGAILMADISHISGLIIGGVHPSPKGHAQIVTSTTHKTLRGPRGAIILCGEEHSKSADKAIFPGLQGGPLENQIMAKAVAFEEASRPSFKVYANQIVKNSKAFASSLNDLGFTLITGGTDNHLMVLDVRNFSINGKEAQLALDGAGITTNKNTIPNDPQSPFITSGVRIGTPAITTRGMKEGEMEQIAQYMHEVLKAPSDSSVKKKVREKVKSLTSNFEIYPSLKK